MTATSPRQHGERPRPTTTRRLWLGVHVLGLGAVAALFVGGLIGQECPRLFIDGSLKTGPFAYGDGATTGAVSFTLMGLYVLSGIAVLVRARGIGPRAAIRSFVNLALVGAILVWATLFSFVQTQYATLCDDRAVRTFVVWFGAATAVIVLLNWPFDRRTGGTRTKPRAIHDACSR